MRNFSVGALVVSMLFVGACSDSTGPAPAVKSGDNQTALAGTPVPFPIVLTAGGGQAASFSVAAGGGTIANTTGTVNSDGTITAPTWTLGKSAVPQQLRVTIGSTTTTINATVKTSYKIDVRFFGRALTTDQKALFTNAAARIRAIIVGQLPLVNANGADLSQCGATGLTGKLSETIDGLVIYASIDSIDGPRKILAQSGPCYIRDSTDYRTSIGIMKFDSADINFLVGSGNLQEVITHEMMHVVGFGGFWDSTAKNLLINYGPNVSYIGAGGIAGCKAIGGVVTCANSVPVEGDTAAGKGTINSHWRESTFGSELMTGFLNAGTNPLSVMTIRSLEDLNYTVNTAAADPFTIPGGSFRASFRSADMTASPTPGQWERPLPHAPRTLPTLGMPPNLRSN